MKSQATSVKVEVSLGLKICPLDRASVACKLKSLLTPAFFVFLAERVCDRERAARGEVPISRQDRGAAPQQYLRLPAPLFLT